MPVWFSSDGLTGIRAVSARRLPLNVLLATPCGKQNKDHQINLGATETRMGCVSPPLSLIQNRTDDFGASFTHLRRSALQPLPQCTATAPAVHCIRPCSALPLFPQVCATVPASTCVRPCKYVNPFPQVFLLNPENGGLITKAKSRILQNHRISCLIQIKALFLPLDYEP